MSIEATERVQALIDLRLSRKRLDFALDASGIVGTWEVDFTTETVRSDERYARLHGVNPKLAKAGADRNMFMAGIFPGDRKRVMAAFDKAKVDGEYRCLHRVNGFYGVRWIISSGRVQKSTADAPLSFAGAVVDITEQVEAATAALQQSEERFSLSFRLTPVPTILATRKGFNLLDVNEAFTAVFGFTGQEVIGVPGADLPIWVSAASRAHFEREMEKSGSFRNVELQFKNGHGEILDCLVSAEAVTIHRKECVLIAIQDITERRRSEVELIEAIEAVMKDASWFSRTVIEKLANLRQLSRQDSPATQLSDLTAREMEVLGLMCQGMTDAEIVKTLKLSRNTVRNHIARIYNKANVHTRAAAIVWARERGFTGPVRRNSLRA